MNAQHNIYIYIIYSKHYIIRKEIKQSSNENYL